MSYRPVETKEGESAGNGRRGGLSSRTKKNGVGADDAGGGSFVSTGGDPTIRRGGGKNDAPSASVLATLRKLFDLARPERFLLLWSGFAMAFGSAVTLAIPSFAGRIIDLSIAEVDDGDSGGGGDDGDVDVSGDSDSAVGPFGLLLRLLGIMTLSSFAGFFRILWQAQAGHRAVARVRRCLYAAVLSQEAAFFDSTKTGDILSRLSSDADLVQYAVTEQILDVLRNIVLSVGAIVLLFHTSVRLALVSIAILPPIAVCGRLTGMRMKETYREVRERHAEATSLAEQALTCIRTVQQFSAERHESHRYNAAINLAHARAIETARMGGAYRSVMGLVVNLALLCVLGYGGALVSRGEMTPGDLASFVMYCVMMGSNVAGISSQYIGLMKAVAAANRVFEVIDREPAMPPPLKIAEDCRTPENEDLSSAGSPGIWGSSKVDPSDDATILVEEDSLEMAEVGEASLPSTSSAPKAMSVEFQKVSFSYPTRPDSLVLNELDLSIGPGQMVALVGGSGGGKSTIASLLTRLYDPTSGMILLDGRPIHEMHPEEVRQNIGIVTQEPLLFPTTIDANIRYGSSDATDAEVTSAARAAHVGEFAFAFADGLQTVVGPRGTQLSGGQKQRVAVARCLLKDPPVLVFDEATSALDAESEAHVQEAIDAAARGRTVIVIAHRLSTIRNVDAIAVLTQGRISEIGSFDDLMKKGPDGAFRQLMDKQLLS